ncbi:PTS sugar transporter subunit IIB [Listeria booriae]|uniref:PTS sugar transporter subunit IIB n=1 Tax=Listeria booriae TaxID=1552123 RepID=UPI00162A4712|nr:PTS sugar transporter subunit IIB [Listeria booriae]MBC1505159.1 PTS sugar transporter subunit IIB [Listeria booriae]
MKNIVLVCAAGMSTSLLVTKMRQAAEAKGMEANIDAYSISEINGLIETADVVLLGPQVRYQKSTVDKLAEPKGVPVDVIDMTAYGTMNGEKVLAHALKLMGEE